MAKRSFNFEVKGRDIQNAEFTLLNGTRRDLFQVQRVSDDTLSVPMNTYDAALVIKVVDAKHLTGEYQADKSYAVVGSKHEAAASTTWTFLKDGQHRIDFSFPDLPQLAAAN